MSQQAFQIIARGPRLETEAAAHAIDEHYLLEGATYSILEEDEDKNIWRIDAFPTSDEEVEAFRDVLAQHPAVETVIEPLADADWLAMALSGLPPVRAGRFFVYGAHDKGKIPDDTVNLRIEAGAAFGTGHHGTTVGCLEAYDELLKTQSFEKVLDVGAGTGLLAIAAAKTGTPLAIGTDIDEPSVRIAGENAQVNDCDARFVHANGLSDPAVAQHAPYDLVFANILAKPLISLTADIWEALKPGGYVILSGLLRTQEADVTAAYEGQGFKMQSHIHHDAWATLVMTRG